MSKILAGVLPVLVTPFDQNGECDTAALASEVEFVLRHGADGVVLGMVSELLRLSSEERDALTEVTCNTVNGRVSVTASVCAESPATRAPRSASSAAWSRKAQDCGVHPRAPGIASQPSGTCRSGRPVRG